MAPCLHRDGAERDAAMEYPPLLQLMEWSACAGEGTDEGEERPTKGQFAYFLSKSGAIL